tara:strand:+ start:561 stop:1124 length:564 start_codon:yes stop_codon:yes gene_type:complete
LNSDDDRELVQQVINGNIDSYSSLVQKYQFRLINLCFKYTKNYHDAEEVAQETFIRAYKSIHNFRFESKFYSWLHRIAINCSLNYINSKEKQKEKETITDYSGLNDTRVSNDNPQDYYQLEGLSKKVTIEYGNLPTELKTVIELYDIQNLSYDEISHKLKIPTGTVRSRLHRAREILINVIKSEVDD